MQRCLLIALLAALYSSCSSPTEPSSGGRRSPVLSLSCNPLDHLVLCAANLFNARDGNVTQSATWSVSDPTVARVERGIVTPLRAGDVDIEAEYEHYRPLFITSFRVDPAAPAQRLYFVSGNAFHGQTQNGVPDVRVTIIDGDGAGASTLTGAGGQYRFDRLLVGATIRMRAEKVGFTSAETTICVPSPVGPAVMECPCRGTPGCLAFRLTPVQ
jgi:hypothetical protein